MWSFHDGFGFAIRSRTWKTNDHYQRDSTSRLRFISLGHAFSNKNSEFCILKCVVRFLLLDKTSCIRMTSIFEGSRSSTWTLRKKEGSFFFFFFFFFFTKNGSFLRKWSWILSTHTPSYHSLQWNNSCVPWTREERSIKWTELLFLCYKNKLFVFFVACVSWL